MTGMSARNPLFERVAHRFRFLGQATLEVGLRIHQFNRSVLLVRGGDTTMKWWRPGFEQPQKVVDRLGERGL